MFNCPDKHQGDRLSGQYFRLTNKAFFSFLFNPQSDVPVFYRIKAVTVQPAGMLMQIHGPLGDVSDTS